MRPLALVTGSWRRIGAHIAVRLAERGYDLALHAGHDVSPEAWLVDALARHGAEHRLFVADLRDPAAVEPLVPRAAEAFGRRVELLVNNASRFEALAGDALPAMAELIDYFAVNAAAPLALARAVAGGGGAAVVNILDQRVRNPPRDQLAYTISKQALAEGTRTLAVALAPHVRVNGVAPGLTLPTDDYAPGQLEALSGAMPLRRLPSPHDIADAVAYLAAARSVTGCTIFVDGGAHLAPFERDFVNLQRPHGPSESITNR
jgi:NAD(P)-dependent dehydrogenase (short-subunit alcohol dehydrogenase family)